MVHGIRGAALTAAFVASASSVEAGVVSGGSAASARVGAALRSAQEFGNGFRFDAETGCIEVFRRDLLPGLECSAYARGYWIDFTGLGSAGGFWQQITRLDVGIDATIDAHDLRSAGVRWESDAWGSSAHAAIEVSRTN